MSDPASETVATASATLSPHPPATTENPPKHQLETQWSFWLRSTQHDKGQSSWNDQQIRGHTFGTVEDFWCLVNSVKDPFEHGAGNSEYSVFRENLKPDYETDNYRNGGRIVLQLPQFGSKGAASKNYDIWVHLLLAVIGENFDDVGGKHIAGLRLVTKKNGGKVEIWTLKREMHEVDKLVQGVKEMSKPFFDSNFTVKFQAFKGTLQMEV
eukprot:Gregarina_sp_Poly_1__11315@NODE_947_length_5591_cov_64_240043_g671_i0_p3_GENE_NODE_947_length_5591_cov_64_240043_g671_i0NODE_947_length_5591_cov_64_240043_g671_i0_p3_ORF_typecomplete_len211_score34_91IF4E/PF01652_18/7_2e29_NODE_947_length_5591_cov_64_240043_g671_i049065538